MFEYDFMIRAYAAGMIVAVVAPVVGVFLVVRRYSLLADTLAHVSLTGVAAGLITGTSPVYGAMAASVLAALGIERLRRTKKVFGESAVALFLWAGLSTAVVLISLARGPRMDIFGYLFGSITTVTNADLYMLAVVAAAVVAVVSALYKQLFLVAFDEETAEAAGVNTRAFGNVIVVMAALIISLAMRIVGILLIGALMVVPVLSAMQWARSFSRTIAYSVVFSICSVAAGLFMSYHFDLASGGAIVLSSLGLFMPGFFLRGRRGEGV
jgi:zinc transport system permease protein